MIRWSLMLLLWALALLLAKTSAQASAGIAVAALLLCGLFALEASLERG